MTEDASRWGAPFAALLGAYNAQLGFGLPSIGGKDSMSGTFNDEKHGEINVPPTLVSFAVDVASSRHIITPELKKAGNKLVVFRIEKDAYDLPVYSQILDGYAKLHEMCIRDRCSSCRTNSRRKNPSDVYTSYGKCGHGDGHLCGAELWCKKD